MAPDVWLSRAAGALVVGAAVLVVAVATCGTTSTDGGGGAATPASPASGDGSLDEASRDDLAPPVDSALDPATLEALRRGGEGALAGPSATAVGEPPARAVDAVDLPSAAPTATTTPRVPSGVPCGGLVVTLITERDGASRASVRDPVSGKARFVGKGETIGGFRVLRIEWDRVWFSGGGSRCSVGIHVGAQAAREAAGSAERDVLGRTASQVAVRRGTPSAGSARPAPSGGVGLAEGAASAASAAPPTSASARRPVAPPIPPILARGIRAEGPDTYRLSDAALRVLFELPEELFEGLQADVEVRGGRAAGVVLRNVLPESLLTLVGIEDGDLLMAVDGQTVEDLATLVRLLEERRRADKLRLAIERDGEPREVVLLSSRAERP